MDQDSPAEKIFFAVLQKSTDAERAEVLDEACGSDADLRSQVERLLHAISQAGGFLERPVVEAENLNALATAASTNFCAGIDRREIPASGLPQSIVLDFLGPAQRSDSLGRLGHYEVLEVVGHGGMGIVMRAFDAKLHRVVAIKALAPALATSSAARERFVREARATAAVNHDNVIAIYAVEDAEAVPYLVMQFIHGCTLEQKISNCGPLPVTEILRVGLQTAQGLAAAHSQGLVHRDVKPANILLENSVERVKITDFGLAQAADDASLTQAGLIAGTPAYMSPEQAAGKHVDQRSDLFSLGSVLYVLCTGESPFRASTTMALLKRIRQDAPRPLREVNPNVPRWLEEIITRLHAKNPADRFQTAHEVAERLGRHLAEVQQPRAIGGPSGQASFVPEPRLRRSSGLRNATVILGLGAAMVGATIAAYRWFPSREVATTVSVARKYTREAPPSALRPPRSLEDLAKLKSPLDALIRGSMELPDTTPSEVLAVLGGKEHFAHEGYDTPVLSVAFSPDGRTLASSGADRTVRLWDLAGWQQSESIPPVRTLKGHADEVWSVGFSPDGKVLASGGTDGRIFLWETPSGRKIQEISGNSRAPSHLTFSPDGRTIAAGGKDGAVNRWDVFTGQPKEPWRGHVGEVPPIAFSPDGRVLASGGKDGAVQLMDAATGARLHTFRGNTSFTNLAFSPDGRILTAISEPPGPALYLWDVESKAEHVVTGHTEQIVGLAFRPDGRWIATASFDGSVRLWDATRSGQELAGFNYRRIGGPFCAAFSPEGRYLAVGLVNGTIAIQRIPSTLPTYLPPAATCLISPDELARRPAAADALKRDQVPDALLEKAGRGDKDKAPAELVAVLGEERPIQGDPPCNLFSVAISPDGKTLAVGGTAAFVSLTDLATGQLKRRLAYDKPLNESHVYTLAFGPDGQLLAAGTRDGRILLWNATTGDSVPGPASLADRVAQLAFSPDSKTLAWAGRSRERGVLRLWNLASGHPMFTASIPASRTDVEEAWCVAFSIDGKTLACGLESGQVWLYDIAYGWRFRILDGMHGRVRWIGFHPDGRSLAVAGRFPDNSVYIWSLTSHEPPRRLSGHNSEVLSAAWRADGRLLVTAGSTDGTVTLWDMASTTPRSRAISVIEPNIPWLHSIALSPEGRHLAVGNPDGTVFLLRLAKPGEVMSLTESAEK
jgi:WD40 repeat protein